jgi:hypothetical protein
MWKKAFLLLFCLSVLASAAHLNIVSPVAQEVTSAEQLIDFGIVGPGQKIEVIADRGTGERVETGGEAKWEQLRVLGEDLPAGWRNESSFLYESPMKAFIVLPKHALDGTYFFQMHTYDEYEGTPSMSVRGKVVVSINVLELEALKKTVVAGVGQPAVFLIRLRNKSSASDAFEISVAGVPAEWAFPRRVFVSHNSEAVIAYEVVGAEKGEFSITIQARSLSSDAITAKEKVSLKTQSSLLNDAQATSHGILLFPSIQQIIYSLIGFAANVLA